MISLLKLRIPLFSLFCLAAFIIIEPSIYLLLMLGSAFLHECGHLLIMRVFGVEIACVTLLPLGIDIKSTARLISYHKQIMISFSGPFVNLLLFFAFFSAEGDFLFFAFFNLLYGIFNLIPIKGLDGAEILKSVLCLLSGEETAEKALYISSFIFCMILWLSGVYILFILNGNISIFALSLIFFSSLFLKKQI